SPLLDGKRRLEYASLFRRTSSAGPLRRLRRHLSPPPRGSSANPSLREREHRGRDAVAGHLAWHRLSGQGDAVDGDGRIAAADEQARHVMSTGRRTIRRTRETETLTRPAP